MATVGELALPWEAELPYATLALATDYDCWHTDHASVTVEAVLDVMRKNIATAKAILKAVAPKLPDASKSPATNAMEHAIMTARDRISDDARTKLKPLVGRYLD